MWYIAWPLSVKLVWVQLVCRYTGKHVCDYVKYLDFMLAIKWLQVCYINFALHFYLLWQSALLIRTLNVL